LQTVAGVHYRQQRNLILKVGEYATDSAQVKADVSQTGIDRLWIWSARITFKNSFGVRLGR
jgi:hypothetical protein